jgi:hypothetical protein
MTAQAPVPADLFLSGYPQPIVDIAQRLRDIVREAVPEAMERVRIGWRIIGYDIPSGSRTRYFAFVGPEPEHCHLGWANGIWLTDPDGMLRGAHLRLKQVRYVTYEPGDTIPDAALRRFTRESADLAAAGRPASSRR